MNRQDLSRAVTGSTSRDRVHVEGKYISYTGIFRSTTASVFVSIMHQKGRSPWTDGRLKMSEHCYSYTDERQWEEGGREREGKGKEG